MTNQHVFIADLEDGCPAAAGWVAYFDHLTLPLTGQALANAQAILDTTEQSLWMKVGYMPRTRDLSASRRRLVQGWCNAVISGGGTTGSSST